MQVGLKQILPRDSILLCNPLIPMSAVSAQFRKHRSLAVPQAHIHVALRSTECYSLQTKDTYSNLVHRCFISDINAVCIVRFSYIKEKFVVQQKLG